jgi:hypothetical protein
MTTAGLGLKSDTTNSHSNSGSGGHARVDAIGQFRSRSDCSDAVARLNGLPAHSRDQTPAPER